MKRAPFVMTSPLPYFVSPQGDGPFAFCADASDLGFAPGEWPEEIPCNIGNKMPLVFYHPGQHGSRWYMQANGCIQLLVYND